MVIFAGLTACQKENLNIQDVTLEKDADIIDVAPLTFPSASALKSTLYSISELQTKSGLTSPVSDFISYAETVMQEDDYDARINAICSEVVGSILNPEGEVIFGDYMMKIGDYGILYSFKENSEMLGRLAVSDISTLDLIPATSFIAEVDDAEMSKIYEIKDIGGIYFYDAFHIVKKMSSSPKTKWYNPSGVTFRTDELHNGLFLTQTFKVPSEGDQKKIFSSNSKIANDTKIYSESILGYKECGVKTKTMKKGFLGTWSKFPCNITAAITDLLIQEPGWNLKNQPAGWADITTTSYEGASYVIATKFSPAPMDINMSAATVEKECNDALAWGKNNGLNVSNIDGIRYIPINAPQLTVVRIKSDITSGIFDKITKKFGLKPQGRFSTDKSSLGNIVVNSLGYEVIKVAMYGYSEYEGEKLGSRLRYQK